MFEEFVLFVKELYGVDGIVALHEPCFKGNEKRYLLDCIDSTFVSTVGAYVDKFEKKIADFTGAKYAIATINGTAALHVALKLSGVSSGDEVITQPLTFVSTCNAISYCGAAPVFVDVERSTLGMCPDSLINYLEENTYQRNDGTYNKKTGRKISAVVPMHTFGHPCRIEDICNVCNRYGLSVVEDAAESLGSYYKNRHTGTFGIFGVLSFNGNKTITSGGGGMVLTDSEELARKARHITTTAKVNHPYEYVHDEIGFNYRMPNLNAALGCAQMENISEMLMDKKVLASEYAEFFKHQYVEFQVEPEEASSNYWLNAVIFHDGGEKEKFLRDTNNSGVMTRPVWRLMNRLEMFKECQTGRLDNSLWLEDRMANIPSSVRI
mgnify:CR=1 FL=1